MSTNGFYCIRNCKLPFIVSHYLLIFLFLLFSHFNHVRLFATPWTIARQAPLATGFPRKDYWSGLPFPSPGDLPDPGIKPASPALAGGLFFFFSLPLSHMGSPFLSDTCSKFCLLFYEPFSFSNSSVKMIYIF